MTNFQVPSIQQISNISLNKNHNLKKDSQSIVFDSLHKDDHENNKNAKKNYVINLITTFYLVILVIYAVVLELSAWIINKNDKQILQLINTNSLIFNLYIYILSFIFFIYNYVIFFKRRYLKNSDKNAIELPSVGSLYIRLGAVVFAIAACVYYGVSVFCGNTKLLDICAIIFTVIQTHLLFYSSTMVDDKNFIVSCFGTMHLVSANLITWFQFLFAKNKSTQKAISKNYKKHQTMSYSFMLETTTYGKFHSQEEMDDRFNDAVEEMSEKIPHDLAECQGVECIFGTFTKVFYTAVVEYSLIAAAIMFIVWHNLEKEHKPKVSHPVQKKSSDRKIWLRQIFGLGVGSVLSLCTIISMTIFFVYCYKNEHYTSATIFSYTDIVQNSVGVTACAFAFWRMRSLKYVNHETDEFHANQQLLDMILLAIGLVGELAFSIAGLMGIYSVHEWQSLSSVLTISHIIQIIQSILQCFVICFASKLRTRDSNEQPGKQSITFLIILNIAMFIYNLFISDKVGTYESILSFYGEENWVFLVRIFSPLTIFFRFHSSVCFVEIWQHTYSLKH